MTCGRVLDGADHVIGDKRRPNYWVIDAAPHVMNQLIGRVDRNPQPSPEVDAFFPVIEDGSDPFIIALVGDKLMQHEGIVEGKAGEAKVLAESGPSDRLREMAEAYLRTIGEASPAAAAKVGLLGEVELALSRLSLTFANEADMQHAIWSVLPELLPGATARREVWVGPRSRLDFLIERGAERVAVECKIDQTGRRTVYAQVRRYIEEARATGCVIYAPWSGVRPFSIGDVPVAIVDWSRAKL